MPDTCEFGGDGLHVQFYSAYSRWIVIDNEGNIHAETRSQYSCPGLVMR